MNDVSVDNISKLLVNEVSVGRDQMILNVVIGTL